MLTNNFGYINSFDSCSVFTQMNLLEAIYNRSSTLNGSSSTTIKISKTKIIGPDNCLNITCINTVSKSF